MSWCREGKRDVLKEFLETYGKVPDAAKEEKRLGQMHRESTTGINADYGLPITVEEYSEAIYPLYIKRTERLLSGGSWW